LVVIRKALKEDVDSISSLFGLFNLPVSVDNNSNCMVVELENKIIGAGCMKITDNRAEITSIAILPEFQHKRFGYSLIRALINFADRRNVSLIYVKTNLAQDFFKKIGFMPGTKNNEMILDVNNFFDNNTCCKN
jgi:N-acetylglutamate synthase-like GNAT family acetyltransferase